MAKSNRIIFRHKTSRWESKVHRAWRSMLERCRNPNNKKYAVYGGRGIIVCSRWFVFEHFLHDMGEPADHLSLDRIDNNGNYEPSNCRWTTRNTQARNKRNTSMLTAFGITKPIADWADEKGLKSNTIKTRLRVGWTPEDAISIPKLSIQQISKIGLALRWAKEIR